MKPSNGKPPVILDARVVAGSGGGPDKTILNSPRFLAPAGYVNLCAYMHPPGDPGFEQLRRKGTCERFDFSRELAFLERQPSHATGDRAKREQRPAQLRILAAFRSHCGESTQERGSWQRPQLATQRFGCGDEQTLQLAKPGPLRVHGSLPSDHQRS